MKTKTIKQEIIFRAEPDEIYGILMDSGKHSKLTNSKCVIGTRVGDGFSTFDGYAEGENLELEKNRKIVQSWRASDWPEKHFSKVTFALKKTKGGTKLSFTQTRVPEDLCQDIMQGWGDYYWKPMKKMLGE